MVTNALMIASSLNSWPRAGTQQHASNAAVRRKTKGVRRCITVHASVGGRRRAIRKMYMHGPTPAAKLYCASENGRERTASPAAMLEASAAVPLTVALAVAVVALDMQELLDAASVDRLTGVDVTLRVDRVAVQVRELRTAIMPRFAQVADDRTARPFHGVHDLVATIDLEEVRLERIVGEAQIPRRARSPEPWRAWGRGPGGTDCAVIAQGHTGARDDRNDAHQVGERLVEHLDPVVAPIARVDVAVVPTHDAVRMATIARREESREISQWIVYRWRHRIVVRPLPEPRHRAIVVVLEYDHAVVAVAVGHVHAAALMRHRIRIRIDPDIGRFVEQRVAHVRCRVAAAVAAGIRRRVVADVVDPDLIQPRRAIVRVFDLHAVAVAPDPDVVLVIDEAAVNLCLVYRHQRRG